MYAVELLPSAAKALSRLDRAVQLRIARRIDRLAADPRADAVKLRGAPRMSSASVIGARCIGEPPSANGGHGVGQRLGQDGHAAHAGGAPPAERNEQLGRCLSQGPGHGAGRIGV